MDQQRDGESLADRVRLLAFCNLELLRLIFARPAKRQPITSAYLRILGLSLINSQQCSILNALN